MSTPTVGERATTSAMAWLLMLPFAWAIGFIGDLPRNVTGNEGILARLGQWTSTVFHVTGALLMAAFGPSWLSWLAAVWGIFAAIVLARRLAARHGVPLYLSDIRASADEWSSRLLAGGVAATVTGAVLGLPSIVLFAGVLATMVGCARPARVVADVKKRNAAAHAKWDVFLGTLFNVNAATVINQQTGLVETGDGGVVLDPVAPAVAAHLDLPALDLALSRIASHLEVGPGSDYTRISLVPASTETSERRASLGRTDGLIAGMVSVAPLVHATVDGQPMPVINLEDM